MAVSSSKVSVRGHTLIGSGRKGANLSRIGNNFASGLRARPHKAQAFSPVWRSKEPHGLKGRQLRLHARLARGTFSPQSIRRQHRASAQSITHFFLRRPPHNIPALPASSSRRPSFAMPLGGKLRFPGGGVFGRVCVEKRDAAATVGPGICRVHLPTRPPRRHSRLGSGASLPKASRRKTFATRTNKMCVMHRAEALCFVRSGFQPGSNSSRSVFPLRFPVS